MTEHRLDKETLRRDPLQEFFFHAVDYVHKRTKMFMMGAIALLVLVAGAIGWTIYAGKLAKTRAEAFYSAEKIYFDIHLPPEQRRADAKKAFGGYIQDHPRSDLAPFALLYQARLAMEENDSAQVESSLKQVLTHGSSSDPLLAIAATGLAKIHEDKQEWDQAEALYKQLPDSYKDLRLFHLGRISLARTNPKEAARLMEELEKLGQESPISGLGRAYRLSVSDQL